MISNTGDQPEVKRPRRSPTHFTMDTEYENTLLSKLDKCSIDELKNVAQQTLATGSEIESEEMLMFAAQNGHLDLCQLFLDRRNSTIFTFDDKALKNPLIRAVQHRHAKICSVILSLRNDQGPDSFLDSIFDENTSDFLDEVLFASIAEEDRYQAAKTLLSYGKWQKGVLKKVLNCTAKNGNVRAFALLWDYPNVQWEIFDIYRSLHHAARNGHKEICQILEKKPLVQWDYNFYPVLIQASLHGHHDAFSIFYDSYTPQIEILYSRTSHLLEGILPSMNTQTDKNLLVTAAFIEQKENCETLLKSSKAYWNTQSINPALKSTVANGNVELTNMMIYAGKGKWSLDDLGTLLLLAIENKQYSVIGQILQYNVAIWDTKYLLFCFGRAFDQRQYSVCANTIHHEHIPKEMEEWYTEHGRKELAIPLHLFSPLLDRINFSVLRSDGIVAIVHESIQLGNHIGAEKLLLYTFDCHEQSIAPKIIELVGPGKISTLTLGTFLGKAAKMNKMDIIRLILNDKNICLTEPCLAIALEWAADAANISACKEILTYKGIKWSPQGLAKGLHHSTNHKADELHRMILTSSNQPWDETSLHDSFKCAVKSGNIKMCQFILDSCKQWSEFVADDILFTACAFNSDLKLVKYLLESKKTALQHFIFE